ncbi:MAG: NrfD/PsrC family molybdoenzyme membrane anchor subunit [Myxococcota bacterium]
MKHERLNRKLVTWQSALLVLIMAAGAGAALMRFSQGLGAATNLSDQWPWGLWKGFNVLVLIALGAGGFTSAALIYIFGGERYHGFARSAVLWGILCYGFAGGSLVVDIAIPWRIVHPIFMWPHHSVLFEVAWCVMLYLSVLGLELLPSVFERFGWTGLQDLWKKLVPAYAVAALSFFTYIMTHSFAWTGAALVFFAFLAYFLPKVTVKSSTPVLLIMFGIILSSLHQSSLGSLFLLVPDKLSHFWWSMRLPVNFLASAVAVGFAMIIVERTLSAWVFKRPMQNDLLKGVAGIGVVFLSVYIGFRLVDVVVVAIDAAAAGQMAERFGGTTKSAMFFVEMALGFVLPAILLAIRQVRENPTGRFVAAILLVLGVAFNRLNTTFLGLTVEGSYVPSMIEVAVSVATVAAMLFLYTVAVKLLPIYDVVEGHEEEQADKADVAGPEPAAA